MFGRIMSMAMTAVREILIQIYQLHHRSRDNDTSERIGADKGLSRRWYNECGG